LKVAVYSDVHANLPALEAVLAQLDALHPDLVLCLGDLVGYHADPSACIAAVRQAGHVAVMGNHDRDTAGSRPQGQGTTSLARLTQEWTRSRLSADESAWLDGLPNRWIDPCGLVAVHGCYLNDVHVTGYVTGTMLPDNLAAVARNAAERGWPKVALCGHTHLPLCGWLYRGDTYEIVPKGRTLRWPASSTAVLLNPGSVGQPRDGDPRAAFALIDLEARAFEVRRVVYDVERAVAVLREAGLPAVLGERLRQGR
jgi:predicted phosphodiesterase